MFTFVNNINQSLNSPNTGIYGLLQNQNIKLEAINTTLGTGSSLSNVLTKLDAIVNWTSYTNSGVQSLVTNGIDINAPALDDIFDLLNTPVLEPFTYVYRSAINTNGSFTSSSNNGYVVGIRTDENTGALRFGQQTLNSQMDYLGIIHNDLLGLNNRMQTMATEYNPILYGQDGSSYSYQSFSIMDSLTMYGNNHGRMLNDILQNDVNIRSELKDINWNQVGSYSGVKTIFNGNYLTTNTDGNEFYAFYNVPAFTNVFKFEVPIMIYAGSSRDANININILQASTGAVYDVLDYSISNASTDPLIVYAYIPNIRSANQIQVHITTDKPLRFNPDLNHRLFSVPRDSIDSLDVSNNIYLNNITKLFEQAKYMFFDDDSIQAKKDNASQTTAVITNFTGSGQASATANDYGTLSSGVNDVKGGMTTNVSADRAFDIFNNQSGYSFWSSETLNELNQSGNSQRTVFKSDISDDYTFYSNRLQYLFDIMNGGDKK